jgi:serine protease Do
MQRMAHLRTPFRTLAFSALTASTLAVGVLSAAEPTATVPTAVPTTAPTQVSATLSVADSSKRRDDNVLLVDRVKAAVVNIHSERTVSSNPDDPFRSSTMQPQRVNGMGTAIVLDPRGYLVTNYHVVDDVQSLRCRLSDGTNLSARVLALDKESDLALVKVDPPQPLPVAQLGTAQDLMLAEKVLAIGNAFGYEHTVTVGTVSALKRDVTLNKEVSYKSLIQTQTPINPGNSGGPLFNRLGEVVGVNVAIRAGAQNIAFAIPVDTMITKAADMLSGKRRSGLRQGLTFIDRYDRSAEEAPLRRWLTVARVESGSIAAESGLKANDIIEQVGDLPVSTSIDFERGLIDRSGKTKIRVKRGGESLELVLGGGTTVERVATPISTATPSATAPAATPSTANADAAWSKTGLKMLPVGSSFVQPVDKQLRGGMWVNEVSPSGSAAKAGLMKGDILLGLHQWETLSQDNVTYVLSHKDLTTFNPLRAIFVRDGKIRETQLNVPE